MVLRGAAWCSTPAWRMWHVALGKGVMRFITNTDLFRYRLVLMRILFMHHSDSSREPLSMHRTICTRLGGFCMVPMKIPFQPQHIV